MNIQSILSEKVKQAMLKAGADEQCEPMIRQSGKLQFGDYQANGIMAAAKKRGKIHVNLLAKFYNTLNYKELQKKPKLQVQVLSIFS